MKKEKKGTKESTKESGRWMKVSGKTVVQLTSYFFLKNVLVFRQIIENTLLYLLGVCIGIG